MDLSFVIYSEYFILLSSRDFYDMNKMNQSIGNEFDRFIGIFLKLFLKGKKYI